MKTLMQASAAIALGVATMAVPSVAAAQDAVGGTNSIEDKRGYDALDEAQKAEYDAWPAEYQDEFWTYPADYRTAYWGWPADYRTAYWAWPDSYQTYYWDLTPEQQTAWWALTDEQRGRILAMTPDQQLAAWESINAQIAAQQADEAETVMASDTVKNDIPPPRDGEYPVCGGDIQDSCIQPRAAGKSYGNVPLDYWPGKPASQM